MTIKSMLVQREIFNKLKSGTNFDIDFLDSSVDIDNDLETSDLKIVFSENCYLKLKELIKEVLDSKTKERGTIFYGRIIDKIVLIDYFESDLELSQGIFENAAVSITEKNIEEIRKLTSKNKEKSTYDTVIHYHVHPSYVSTEKGIKDNNENGLKISDQDLFTYGWLKTNLQSEEQNEILYIGAVSSVNYGISPQLRIVTCDTYQEKFFKYDNVYYFCNSQLYKIDLNNTNIEKSENNKALVNKIKNDFKSN